MAGPPIQQTSFLLLSSLLFASIITEGNGAGCQQMRDGCKIDNDRCVCGYGCPAEFRYSTKADCQKAIRGLRQDICQRIPCLHGGTCSQITQDPQFKCRCDGTGYYGDRCEKACPKKSRSNAMEYPFACIVI